MPIQLPNQQCQINKEQVIWNFSLTEWCGAGMVICLGRDADFHMAQLMPLPLTISCSSKSRLVLPFSYRLIRVVPDKGPLNGCCYIHTLISADAKLLLQLLHSTYLGFCSYIHFHTDYTWPLKLLQLLELERDCLSVSCKILLKSTSVLKIQGEIPELLKIHDNILKTISCTTLHSITFPQVPSAHSTLLNKSFSCYAISNLLSCGHLTHLV